MTGLARRDFLGAMLGGAAAFAAPKPNIVLIMADDLGFSDIGCYGGEIETPNLDSMAKAGLRFTQFTNTARCCPTRASLLTGVYPHQAGVGHMIDDRGLPGYRGQLSPARPTVAELLRSAGYATGMSGKWHVTNLRISGKRQLNFESDEPFWTDKTAWPAQRGFDEFYGTIAGVENFYDPFSLVRGNELTKPDSPDFYYTDAITNHAVATIEKHSRSGKPFFHYVAHTAPHWPLHALEREIRKYRRVYRKGWDAIRAERYARLLKMGLIDRRWNLTPRDETVPAWASAPNQEWEAERMAVYAAMVDRMDQGIGRILATLRRLRIADNTLVLFLSDNGGCAENVQPNWYDIPSKTRAGKPIHVGNDPAVLPGKEETWLSYGPAWANVSNTPFRLYKHWVHEGGIATPLIAHFPGRIQRPGSLHSEPGHVIDLLPTCLDAAGAAPPRETEGRSLLPLLAGRSAGLERALFWEHEGNRAVRQGKWKLVSKFPGPWELYDMEADRTELNDLAGSQPERAAAMARLYDSWAARANVVPWEQLRRQASVVKK
jgi:arylsulfatase